MYEKLAKIYYKQSESEYQNEYEKRFNDYGAVKLPFTIKPLKSNEEFQCFYVHHHNLMMLYERIKAGSSVIQELMRQLPEAALSQYIESKLVDELIGTNEIEGIRSTRAEMKRALDVTHTNKKTKFKSLVMTYIKLLEKDTANKLEEFQDIREIYDMLVSDEIDAGDQLDGEIFRKEGVHVENQFQKVIHKGVTPESAIKESLTKLIIFLNEYRAPTLYKIAIAHYYFGYIHPYYDGNGRTSRYISSLYLKDELDILTSLTLSYGIVHNKKLYYDGFDDANDRLNKGELSHFCETFFKILLEAQHYIIDELNKKLKQLAKLAKFIVDTMDTMKEDEKDIVFILGQMYLFASEERVLKRELETVIKLSSYRLTKTLGVLVDEGLIDIVGQKPKLVMLTEKVMDLFD